MTDFEEQIKARLESILRTRADNLAARGRHDDERDKRMRAFVCEAAGHLFGLPVEKLARIAAYEKPARLISDNAALLGLASRDGQYFQTYDLASLLRLPRETGADAGHTVFLRHVSPPIAFRVDRARAIEDLLPIENDLDASAAPAVVAKGYARASDGRLVTLIDLESLLAAQNRAGRASEGGSLVDL